jgi:cytochrome c peroxidase
MASAARTFTRAIARSNPVRPVARSTRFALPAHTLRASGRRGYSSETGSGSSNTGLYLGLGLAVAGGAGYYFYSNGGDVKAKASGPVNPTKEDYQKVYDEIARLLVEKDDYDDGSYGPVCHTSPNRAMEHLTHFPLGSGPIGMARQRHLRQGDGHWWQQRGHHAIRSGV